MKKGIIAIIGKKDFPNRLHIKDIEFAGIIYEQIKFALNHSGEKLKNIDGRHPDKRIGVYLDTKNDGVEYYELKENDYYDFLDNFGHSFFKELESYSKREQKKGTDILFQLNTGNLSTKDFEDKF